MCQAGPRWRPNHEIVWHTERLLLHVRTQLVSVLLRRTQLKIIDTFLNKLVYKSGTDKEAYIEAGGLNIIV